MPDMYEKERSSFIYRNRSGIFFGLIAVITAINLTIDIMEVDAAQYASISYEMSQTDRYLQVYHNGRDYLDKPPLLFWLSSLSISIVGNTNPGYKLPAVLFLWLGLWATYRFGKLWYDRRTGIIAAFVMGTTQAFHLMTNDVRTDGLLTSFVMLSIYFLSVYLKKGTINSLLLGGVCIGGAMLAKGPLGLFIPAIAIFVHLLIRKEWKKIFNWKWLLLVPVILIVLAPMLYGLYIQFDMHPEKEVYGIKGPSGIGFYFWTQSFGRITGESTWSNDTSPLYFMQTILWDLSPWIFLFIAALVLKIKDLFQKGHVINKATEWISLAGFVIPFIALSFSNYKLPHYIFPLFPFAAVMIAEFATKRMNELPKFFEKTYMIFLHVFVLIALLVLVWVFPTNNIFIIFISVVLYALFWLVRKSVSERTEKMLCSTVVIALLLQFVLSAHFYPQLLKYQSASQAGKWIGKEQPPEVFFHKKFGFGLQYYSGRDIESLSESTLKSISPGTMVYTDEDGLNDLKDYKIIKEFKDYPVTLLSYAFLNPALRESKLKKAYLVEIVE